MVRKLQYRTNVLKIMKNNKKALFWPFCFAYEKKDSWNDRIFFLQ